MNKKIMNLEDIDFSDMSKRLFVLMSKHIGSKKAISRTKLFKYFFGDHEEYNRYQILFLNTKILCVVSYLRRKTHCFIINERRVNDNYLYVAKTQTDANMYIKKCNDAIKGIRGMQKLAQKAINKKWYNDVIRVSTKEAKKLKNLKKLKKLN